MMIINYIEWIKKKSQKPWRKHNPPITLIFDPISQCTVTFKNSHKKYFTSFLIYHVYRLTLLNLFHIFILTINLNWIQLEVDGKEDDSDNTTKKTQFR